MVEFGSSDLTVEDLREMYRLMLMGRRFTERTLELYEEGRLKPYHPSAGQEAVGVGACYGLKPSDWVIPSLRTTEAFWTRGLTMQENLNAMLGNSGSISSGKESFHHAGYPKLGILAGTALVAAQIPVAVGAALALRMRRTDGVTVCFFGDGSTARGEFHEGLNLAAVLNLPVVFICENNLYFQTAPAATGMAVEDISDRAIGYGMPGRVVDGQDVRAVYEATKSAVGRARNGEGPTLLECKTYRFLRHHPTQIDMRDPEERARWMERDPIKLLDQRLRDKGYIDDAVIQGMESAIKQELEDAIVKAEATPPADPKKALTNVYAQPLEAMRI